MNSSLSLAVVNVAADAVAAAVVDAEEIHLMKQLSRPRHLTAIGTSAVVVDPDLGPELVVYWSPFDVPMMMDRPASAHREALFLAATSHRNLDQMSRDLK